MAGGDRQQKGRGFTPEPSFRTTGPRFQAVPFDSAAVVGTNVGTATLTFTDGNTASFAYTVNGISQTKAISREILPSVGDGVPVAALA